MSMIYFLIYTLFFLSTISALRSPRDVYSAVIYNQRRSSVNCRIIWSQPLKEPLQGHLFTINKNESYVIKEKHIKMEEGWTARLVIQEIHCGKLILTAPFDKVTSPTVNWKFVIKPNQILSVGPN